MKKSERPLERVKGSVNARTVLGGTASQHEGIVLTTDGGEQLHLQRVGGNPFGDDVTRALTGTNVTVEGYRLGGVFRYVSVHDGP